MESWWVTGEPATNYNIAARRICPTFQTANLESTLLELTDSQVNDSQYFSKYLEVKICTHSVNADSEIFISAQFFPPQDFVFEI